MFELVAAFVALVVVLSISFLKGRFKQQDARSRALECPGEVARLYLRHAAEMDAYWLHVQFRNGRKRVLAAPWELAETLELLAQKGLRLTEEDALVLAQRAEAAAADVGVAQAKSRPGPDFGLAGLKAGAGV